MLGIILTNLFLFSCNISDKQNQKFNNETILPNTLINNLIYETEISDTTFLNFVLKFKRRELPYELPVNSIDWIDFYSLNNHEEIPRGLVIKYLCNKDDKKLNQPGGGLYQYYYGYSINFPGNLYGLIYYRTSLIYTGYILAIFNQKGQLIDDIFLSGVKGEFDPEAQKEAKILADGSIEITEILLDEKANFNGKPFEAKIITEFFKINDLGKIEKTKEPFKKTSLVFSTKAENKGRIEIKE